LFEYINCHKPSTVICPKHGEFKITPTSLKAGCQCLKCVVENLPGGYSADFKYNPNKSVYIYILKLEGNGETFYKIGLTFNIKKRSYQLPYKVTILKIKQGTVGNLYPLEQRIIKSSWISRYRPLIKFSGYTECFQLK